jgi:DNA-binding MarR family transcriptional regulator
LVSRHPHESDRRAHRVCLLAAGRRVFERARKIAQELQQTIMADLPIEEREHFLAQLEVIADACSSATDRATPRRRTK